MRTLLTGFGPFGEVVSNPTERLVVHFAAEGVLGQRLTTLVLPTSFARAPLMLRAALELAAGQGVPYDSVLMLGVAANSPCWRVEMQGRNGDDPRLEDVDGCTRPGGPIVTGAPSTLPVTLDAERQFEALQSKGLPVQFSDSAGGYLCNHVLYITLHYLRLQAPDTKAGFLHIPADEATFAPTPDGPPAGQGFPFSRHVEAVQAVLEIAATPVMTAGSR